MFRNSGSFILVLRSMLIVSFVLSTFSFSPLLLGDASAEVSAPVSLIGEAIADKKANAVVVSPSGERLQINSSPMPVISESRIQTAEGTALITLSPSGLIEVLKDSEIMIDRFADRKFISIAKGAIRFAVPATDNMTIAIPSVGLSITPEFPMVSAVENVPVGDLERSGIVELLDDGRVLVSSSKGMLKVSSVNGNSMMVSEGKSFMMAKAGSKISGGRVAGIVSRSHNLLLLGATAVVATGVVLISDANDSGGGWVASGP
jgi:hypothetical protein